MLLGGLVAAKCLDQYNYDKIEQLFSEIYRVPIPLPDNSLGFLNSHFILSDDKTTIIDVGFNHSGCEAVLENVLRALDRDWESVEIVFTHSHLDHTSNLDRI